MANSNIFFINISSFVMFLVYTMALCFNFHFCFVFSCWRIFLPKIAFKLQFLTKTHFLNFIVYFRCEWKQILAGNLLCYAGCHFTCKKCIVLLIYIWYFLMYVEVILNASYRWNYYQSNIREHLPPRCNYHQPSCA